MVWRLSDADVDVVHVKVSPVDHSPRTFEFSGENHERTEHTTDVISKYTRPREELKGNILNLVHSILGTNGMKFRRLWGFGQKESRK